MSYCPIVIRSRDLVYLPNQIRVWEYYPLPYLLKSLSPASNLEVSSLMSQLLTYTRANGRNVMMTQMDEWLEATYLHAGGGTMTQLHSPLWAQAS